MNRGWIEFQMSRPLADLRKTLYSAVVSDALDGLGYPNQSPAVDFSIRTSDEVLMGRCRTTLWQDVEGRDPKPYEKELAAVDLLQADDVMVCAAGGSRRSGIWGELLSTAAKNRGCVGAIVDGAVRDIAKMKAMGFAVQAVATCVYDSLHRQRVIDYDTDVKLGAVKVSSGDLIIADTDGIVIVPKEIEGKAIEAAWKKVFDENRTRDAIRGGMGAAEAYERYGVL